jgi:tetratricopeptide (TPR) repeat protein
VKRVPPALVLVGAVAVVYLNSFRGDFQFDDYNVIVGNRVVHGWRAFLAALPGGIRPLLKLTYTLNWTSGLGLFGFHLVNVALHAANAFLLFRIAKGIGGPPASDFAAMLAALLFAVHPAQTEAVTYLSGRSVSLMAFFSLGCILSYLRGRERGSRLLLYIASPLLFLLAVLSKEVALALPFALLLVETIRGDGTGWKSAFAAQAVHWAMLFLLALAFLVHSGYGRLLTACFDIRSAASNLFTQIHGVAYLISRLALPHALNIDPDLPVYPGWTPSLLPEALFLLVLLAAGAVAVRKRALAGFGILWFFLHLAPTNSFIPRLDVANDRQLYLASWGLFLSLSSGADILRERGGVRWVAAGAVLVLVLLGGITVSRNEVYRSEIALWEDTAAKSPGKARVHNNLGYAYEQAGRFGEARESYLRALAIEPGHALARGNLDGLDAGRQAGGAQEADRGTSPAPGGPEGPPGAPAD